MACHMGRLLEELERIRLKRARLSALKAEIELDLATWELDRTAWARSEHNGEPCLDRVCPCHEEAARQSGRRA